MKDFIQFLTEEKIKNKNAKINIVAIQGSPRNENCCPDRESKSYKLLKNAIKDREDVSFDFIDLSIKCDGNIIQPCKACVSTAGGYHCHWPCSCFSKKSEPKDFMYQENVYKKLENCDGFVVFSPINWDAPSSVVKSFFDRLVCCNLTLSIDDAKSILGKDNIKNSEITRKMAKSGEHNNLLKNHLEGKFAAFFLQGDNGADDYKNIKKPDSYIEYMKGKTIKSDPILCIEPIVKQLVYSGIYVKDGCVDGLISGFGTDYPANDDNLEQELFKRSRKVVDNLIKSIMEKK